MASTYLTMLNYLADLVYEATEMGENTAHRVGLALRKAGLAIGEHSEAITLLQETVNKLSGGIVEIDEVISYFGDICYNLDTSTVTIVDSYDGIVNTDNIVYMDEYGVFMYKVSDTEYARTWDGSDSYNNESTGTALTNKFYVSGDSLWFWSKSKQTFVPAGGYSDTIKYLHYIDRGTWVLGEMYYCAELNDDGIYETSDVWYNGCKWRCLKTGTMETPAWNSSDWKFIEGNPEFTVDFVESESLFDADNFDTTLTIVAYIYNTIVTDDIEDSDVVWSRYSEDADGVERTNSDEAWNLRRSASGKQIELTTDDCDFNGYIPKVLKFTATVTLRDDDNEEVATASISFEYSR